MRENINKSNNYDETPLIIINEYNIRSRTFNNTNAVNNFNMIFVNNINSNNV
ncbi:hypothetical protein BCR32DRAFT_283948 [Anaeromyces robustus]|uniref:Uncharacterized protein n=1 Tax=Anaeromyces robustus TaxID=1754192 RepID=A0A1Y1WSZ5_9FUNG|nr:hypothetical protein BCR32DRAFT_283948 [Anaeromyces robustus]|eukprot:ORX76653.1 hypothetical protein BCR32DRAFT_283948 [Anaeromyces robustus]